MYGIMVADASACGVYGDISRSSKGTNIRAQN